MLAMIEGLGMRLVGYETIARDEPRDEPCSNQAMVVDISVRGCKMTLRVWQLARPASLSIAQDTIT